MSTESGHPEPATSVTVSDPKSMRALAHPLRLKLLGILRVEGARSVGQLSELVDEAPGTVSYHLGTLAKFGFVVEAPEFARDGRERWWRAAHGSTRFDMADVRDDPERLGASVAMRQMVLQHYLAEQLQALDLEAALADDWLAATTSGDIAAYLTVDEAAEMSAEVQALAERWWDRGRTPREDARAVRLIYSVFPRP